MKKIKIIFGKEINEPTGKSFLASQISIGYDNPVKIDTKGIEFDSPFAFSQIDETTDLIIIDEITKKSAATIPSVIYPDNIWVEKRGKTGFSIKKPRIIIIIPVHPKEFFEEERGASFYFRCDFIETSIHTSKQGVKTFISKKVNPFELFQD